MVASTDIKFFVHSNNNAPQLQNAYGSIINVLNACLVDGIFVGDIASIAASGVTATVVFAAPHNLMRYQVIKIEGANQSEFNKEFKVLSVPNSTTVTLELDAAPSVSAATGVMSASLASLGWEKPFSSSNPSGGGKAAYRSTNLLLPSRPFLRVVDEPDPAYNTAYAKYAKVGIVEDMTDIDTMLGAQAPFDAANLDKNWVGMGNGTTAFNGWAKWYYARNNSFNYNIADTSAPTNTSNSWLLIGKQDYFYVLPSSSNNPLWYPAIYGFGSFESYINADTANWFLASTLHYHQASLAYFKNIYNAIGITNNIAVCILKNYKQNTVGLAKMLPISNETGSQMFSGYANYAQPYLSVGSELFLPMVIQESIDNALRGVLPGVYFVPHITPRPNFQALQSGDKRLLCVRFAPITSFVSSNPTGEVVFDLGGDHDN